MSAAGELVDTHCHLVLLDERSMLDEALAGAHESGVTQIVSVGLNVEDSDANRVIAERFDNVWFTVGWHPHERNAPDAAQLHALDELLSHPRAVAVGEIGLDLLVRPGYSDTPLDVQRRAMHQMLELAAAHDKPAVVHDRDAHEETLALIRAHRGVRGVMHCFSGDAAFAQACVDEAWVVSFSGIVTFPRSDAIQEAARTVGAGAYVVETDAPFLAPVPHRGRANRPAYVADTAAAVARLRGEPLDTVRRDTTRTARRLFALPTPG